MLSKQKTPSELQQNFLNELQKQMQQDNWLRTLDCSSLQSVIQGLHKRWIQWGDFPRNVEHLNKHKDKDKPMRTVGLLLRMCLSIADKYNLPLTNDIAKDTRENLKNIEDQHKPDQLLFDIKDIRKLAVKALLTSANAPQPTTTDSRLTIALERKTDLKAEPGKLSDIVKFCNLIKKLFQHGENFDADTVKKLEHRIIVACEQEKLNYQSVKELLDFLLLYKKNNPHAALIFAYSQKSFNSGKTSEIMQMLLDSVGIKAVIISPHRTAGDYRLRKEELENLKDFNVTINERGIPKIEYIDKSGKKQPITLFVTGHHGQEADFISGIYATHGIMHSPADAKVETNWKVDEVAAYLRALIPNIGTIQLCVCYGRDMTDTFAPLCSASDAVVFGVDKDKQFMRLGNEMSLTQLKDIIKENMHIMTYQPKRKNENYAFEHLDYYHGEMTHDAAFAKLSENKQDNTYLLRYSASKGEYYLLMKKSDFVTNIPIKPENNNVQALKKLIAAHFASVAPTPFVFEKPIVVAPMHDQTRLSS